MRPSCNPNVRPSEEKPFADLDPWATPNLDTIASPGPVLVEEGRSWPHQGCSANDQHRHHYWDMTDNMLMTREAMMGRRGPNRNTNYSGVSGEQRQYDGANGMAEDHLRDLFLYARQCSIENRERLPVGNQAFVEELARGLGHAASHFCQPVKENRYDQSEIGVLPADQVEAKRNQDALRNFVSLSICLPSMPQEQRLEFRVPHTPYEHFDFKVQVTQLTTDFTEDNVSDGGDIDEGRISPCTYRAWAVGAKRHDAGLKPLVEMPKHAGRLPRLDRYVARDRSLTVFQSEPDLEVNPGYSVKDDESLHFDTEEEKYYI